MTVKFFKCHFDSSRCHCNLPLLRIAQEIVRCGHCDEVAMRRGQTLRDGLIRCEAGSVVVSAGGATWHRCPELVTDAEIEKFLATAPSIRGVVGAASGFC